MPDFSLENIQRGWNHLVDEADQAAASTLSQLSEEWHSWAGSGKPTSAKEADHPAAKATVDATKQTDVIEVPKAQATLADASAIPAPDKNGVLTVSADSPNFQKAIEQPNVNKIVINQPGDVNFQVGLTTNAQNKPVFVGQIYEKQGGEIDKTFALPGNVDYVTINQIKKSADGKTDMVTTFTQVAGQGRLTAYKQALSSDQFYPGSFELKPVAGVPHTYPIPPTAGSNDVFHLVKNAGKMNDDLLELGETQFRHDVGVPENNKDPWFNVTLAKLDTLEAGKNLADCNVVNPIERDNIANNAYNFLNRAEHEYQVAQDIARTHLDDEHKRLHNPIYGFDPRNWREIPRTTTGALDWKNPQADLTYYGSALDLSNYEQAQAKIAKERIKTASHFICTESLDQLLP
jgi:hypothetical protein